VQRRHLVKEQRAGEKFTGNPTDDLQHGPLLLSSRADRLAHGTFEATAFRQLVLDRVFY
jgi:hypothetical protein